MHIGLKNQYSNAKQAKTRDIVPNGEDRAGLHILRMNTVVPEMVQSSLSILINIIYTTSPVCMAQLAMNHLQTPWADCLIIFDYSWYIIFQYLILHDIYYMIYFDSCRPVAQLSTIPWSLLSFLGRDESQRLDLDESHPAVSASWYDQSSEILKPKLWSQVCLLLG